MRLELSAVTEALTSSAARISPIDTKIRAESVTKSSTQSGTHGGDMFVNRKSREIGAKHSSPYQTDTLRGCDMYVEQKLQRAMEFRVQRALEMAG